MGQDVFPAIELESRLTAVRQAMGKRNLDGIVVTVPENIYYLTGLDHWGYFACHALLVPLEGDMGLMCRQMEHVTVENQVTNAEFYGHPDTEEPSDHVIRMIADAAGLQDYRRHHCGYLVGIGFPPSWTGGSMVTSLQPGSLRELKAGMAFHAHSWFTNTDCVDYFISNTVLLTEDGAEILTTRSPQTLVVR